MRFLKYACLLSLALLLSACGEDPLSASVTVKYQITGSAEAVNIDYIDSSGDLSFSTARSFPGRSHSPPTRETGLSLRKAHRLIGNRYGQDIQQRHFALRGHKRRRINGHC